MHVRFSYTLDFSGEITDRICKAACGRGYVKDGENIRCPYSIF